MKGKNNEILKKIKGIMSDKKSQISINVVIEGLITILLVSITFNALSFNKISEASLNLVNSFFGGIKYLNDSFSGSFLGGYMAIRVYRLQKSYEKKQQVKRLMFLLLSTYKNIKLFQIQGTLDTIK